MQISYDDFKMFACNLYQFAKEIGSEPLMRRTETYIKNNVTVNVPDEIYEAVKVYREGSNRMVETLARLTEPKKRRKT